MSIVIAGACAAAVGGIYGASCFAEVRGVHEWREKEVLWRTSKKHIILTFDDGPHPEKTPVLLDILEKYNAKAVFFVVGEMAKKYPDLVRRMSNQGHQIGNHSWSHPWLIARKYQTIFSEIQRCQEMVEDITGQSPRMARPPYGQKDFRYYAVLKNFSLTPVLWSRNLRDYWGSSARTLRHRLERSRDGDILLMHDGDPKAIHTVEAVDRWLESNPNIGLI